MTPTPKVHENNGCKIALNEKLWTHHHFDLNFEMTMLKGEQFYNGILPFKHCKNNMRSSLFLFFSFSPFSLISHYSQFKILNKYRKAKSLLKPPT